MDTTSRDRKAGRAIQISTQSLSDETAGIHSYSFVLGLLAREEALIFGFYDVIEIRGQWLLFIKIRRTFY